MNGTIYLFGWDMTSNSIKVERIFNDIVKAFGINDPNLVRDYEATGKSGSNFKVDYVVESLQNASKRVFVIDLDRDPTSERIGKFLLASKDCDATQAIGITKSKRGLDGRCTALCEEFNIRVFEAEEKEVEGKGLIKTGIGFLDEIVGGGLRGNGVYLVSGESGTGRSIFASLFLAEGTRHGERGLMIKTDGSVADFISDTDILEIGFRRLVDAGMINVVEVSDKIRAMKYDLINGKGDYRMYVTRISNEIMQLISKKGIKRLVIDTVNPLMVPNENFVHLFVNSVRFDGVTTLLTVMLPSSFGTLEAYVTGSIMLEYNYEADAMVRRLAVKKMRGVPFSNSWAYFTIDGSGFRALNVGVDLKSPLFLRIKPNSGNASKEER